MWDFHFFFFLFTKSSRSESRLAATAASLGGRAFFFHCRHRRAADETVCGETDGAVHAERRPWLVTHAAPFGHSLFLPLLLPFPIIHSPFYEPGEGGCSGREVGGGVRSRHDKLPVAVRAPSRQRTEGSVEIDAGCSPLPPQEDGGRGGGRGNLNLSASRRRHHLSKLAATAWKQMQPSSRPGLLVSHVTGRSDETSLPPRRHRPHRERFLWDSLIAAPVFL